MNTLLSYNAIRGIFRKKIGVDISIALIYRIFIVFLLFTFCRFVFYFYNISHFENIPFNRLVVIFLGGLRFDTTAILYFNLLFLLGNLLPFTFRHNAVYQKSMMFIFMFTNSIGLVANFMDIPYFNFVLERTNIGVFDQFSNESNLVPLFLKFFTDYWALTLLYFFTVWLMYFLYHRISILKPFTANKLVYYPVSAAIFLISIGLIIGGIRGGFGHSTRPITMSNAGEYVKAPIETALVLNTPFTIIRSAEAPGFKRVNYFENEQQLYEIYRPVHRYAENREFIAANIVIVIVESLNREFIGSLNPTLDSGNYKGYMPFLDSLLNHSKTFAYSFANGRKSIDALPAVLASVPVVENPFVLSPYFKNNLTSIASLLKPKGYKSALFHGAPNGSMGFQAFGQMTGIDEYYGKNEYNNNADFDGMWGIWDEEFLQYFAHCMDTFTQPFFSTIFTVSSHHPFKVPAKHEGRFKMDDFPLQKCIRYTDYSLQKFFETVSKMDWYHNTLFVITADHVSINQRTEFMNEAGYFSVPVIFYKPQSSLKGIDSLTLAQQIDILPSIMDYLGYGHEFISFGKSLFNPGEYNFVVNFQNGVYRIYKGDYMLRFDGKNAIGLFRFKNDPLSLTDLSATETETRNSLEMLVKAFVQQLKNRMIENDLVLR